ncbi:MAG: hypothetical protein HOD37_05440 [Bacteroidetes bacterium]|nr:hypothetical protein [Bacteroidota bacterium]
MSDPNRYLLDILYTRELSRVCPLFIYSPYYSNTSVDDAKGNENYINYGVLYNHSASAISCPHGSNLPTNEEWVELENYVRLNYSVSVGGALKADRLWNEVNYRTFDSGFEGLPPGIYTSYGGFSYLGGITKYWTTSSGERPWTMIFWELNTGGGPHTYSRYEPDGYSVRCVKD